MVSISASATKALGGAQRLAKNSKGIREFSGAIRKLGPAKLDLDTLFSDALRNKVGHCLTELGELMGDMATVATRHGSDGLQVIKGLTKYADEAVDGAGNINSSYWDFFGPIIHGRRAEIEFLAKNADAVPGTHVAFEVVKKEVKRISDVDAFLNGAAVSIKRQGKTLDKWVKDRGEDWLKKYMTKVMTGGGTFLR